MAELDRFILARLETAGLKPAEDADRYTWLRRVSLDLTGIPPTPQNNSDFNSDQSPEAYARVVDRLLASRAFGERWARHWLDLVGYADQIGLDNNVFGEHSWRYRDYLIDAYNSDKPFNRTIREQIAGDLLPWHDIHERAANLVATGFLILGDIAIVDSDKDRLRVDIIDQQIDKIGKAYLGLTLGCARCHDHKFDPIKQTDYYALGGMFYSTASFESMNRGVWSKLTVADLPQTVAEQAELTERMRRHAEKLAGMESDLEQIGHRTAELDVFTSENKELPADILNSIAEEREVLKYRQPRLRSQIDHDRYFTPTPPRTFAVHDIAQPQDMAITIRGNAHALGEVVPRGFVCVVEGGASIVIPPGESGRRQLADWVADPRNPLTARVAVNRIWQHLFGFGIVRSVDYFGKRGDTPSHPELLDFLAARFVRQGWSQKTLIRELVLSRAYRMSSADNPIAARIDPENRLLWRMNRLRMDAETLRDSMLAVSGRLTESTGGPALALEFPENVTNLDPKDVNPPGFRLSVYRPEQPFQRTIYLPIIRSGAQMGPAEIRNAFDFPQPAQCSGQRVATSVPTQAMFLMNSPMLKQRAAELAERILKSPGDEPEHLRQLWLTALNRPIIDFELQDSYGFLDQIRTELAKHKNDGIEKAAWAELCHALLASNEFLIRL